MARPHPVAARKRFRFWPAAISSPSMFDLPDPAQPEPAQAVPVLGLGEERLDPDLPFAHRLLVGLGGVVAAHPVQVVGVEGAVDDAAVVAVGASRLERAGVAGRGVGPVDDAPPRCTWPLRRGSGWPCGQRYASALGVVGELALPKNGVRWSKSGSGT